MKLLPLFFSTVVSTTCGMFAVTSWAVEGTASTRAPSCVINRVTSESSSSNAQPSGEFQSFHNPAFTTQTAYCRVPGSTDWVASDGADHVGGVRRKA